MTEQEMAKLLDFVSEPISNRVKAEQDVHQAVQALRRVFGEARQQRSWTEPINSDIWLSLLPWYGLS